METLKTIQNPNFSIILPGPCNGRCKFCFWQRDENEVESHIFSMNLMKTLAKLPSQFRQVSITGGEPTYSTSFLNVCTIIEESRRFDKVVLTTNGSNLWPFLSSAHMGVITNVNISRHAISDQANARVFNTRPMNLLSLEQIRRLNEQLNRHGFETCVNAVITEEMDDPWVFVEKMRSIGFTEACFRKQHAEGSDLSPTLQELGVMATQHRVAHSECPVCRSDMYLMRGMRTWWTASIPEPTDLMVDEIYELVFHPDGKLYADWSKNIEVEL